MAWSRISDVGTLKLITLERNNIFKYFFHFNIALEVIYKVLNFYNTIQTGRASLLRCFELLQRIDGNKNHGEEK